MGLTNLKDGGEAMAKEHVQGTVADSINSTFMQTLPKLATYVEINTNE
jgi:hypothetical protein